MWSVVRWGALGSDAVFSITHPSGTWMASYVGY